MRMFCRSVDDGGGAAPERSDVVPPAAAPAAAPAPAPAPASPEWNGELESLAREAWYTGLPAEVRPAVESGLRNKHSTWQRGYQARMTAAEQTVRGEYESKISAAEQRAVAAERAAKQYTEFFGADNSEGEAAVKAELEKANAEVERLKAIEGEFTTTKTTWEEERVKLAAERDEAVKWRDERIAQEEQHEVDRYVEANKDLLDDEDAREMLGSLIEKQGMDADEAAAKLRTLLKKHGHGAPAAAAPAPAPAATPAAPAAPVAPPAPVAPARPDPIDMMSAGDTTNGGFRGPPGEMTLHEAAAYAYKASKVRAG